MEKLILRAKELGIQDAENLTEAKLKAAIKSAEKALDDLVNLQNKAKELGLDTENVSAEDLAIAIQEEETARAEELAREAAEELLQEKIEVIKTYFGIEDFTALSPDELLAVFTSRFEAVLSTTEDNVEIAEEGKTDETFTSSKGKEYGFAESAPASFRYMGILRTQKEWISDKDAMELMVSGNLSYVTLKN